MSVVEVVALWDRYVTQGRTAEETAAEFGVTKNIVITALHAQRIPVRPPGPSAREPNVLLDALYSDPDVRAILDRHQIPIRPDAGTLRERWPNPSEPDEDALRELLRPEKVGAVWLWTREHLGWCLPAVERAGAEVVSGWLSCGSGSVRS